MKAVILAGGKGTRLQEVVSDVPKPMAPVAGRPFLEYLVLQLCRWGITDIVLSVGYKGDRIKSYFGTGEGRGINIRYSEEECPLGTGGAIKRAASAIEDDAFIAMNGDSFLDLNFDDFITFYNRTGAQTALALAYVGDTSRYGRVVTGENSRVIQFTEKGLSGPGLINGGIYLFSREVIDGIPEGNVSVEQDVFPGLIKRGIYGMRMEGYFVDMGIPDRYAALCSTPDKLVTCKGGPGCII